MYNCARTRVGQTNAGGDAGPHPGRPPPTLFSPRGKTKIMAKTICKILGVVFILVGLIGFVSPGFLGTHLSLTHNLVHIISGAIALYFGFAATLSAARLFCIIFGVVYGLLGIC